MYKKIWFFGFFTLFLNAEVIGSPYFESKLGCEVLHQSIVENDDTKIDTFIGYKNSLSVGDTFFLRYVFAERNGEITYFNLERSKTLSFDNALEDLGDPFVGFFDISFDKSTLVIGGGDNTFASYVTNDRALSKAFEFRMNSVTANYVFENTGILLNRYFGNDFIGTYTSTTNLMNEPIVTIMFSFSCQHLTESHWDKISKILNAP